MKTAKEMFEKLGYTYVKLGNTMIVYSKFDNDSHEYRDIIFNNETKKIVCKSRWNYFESDGRFYITLQELQAINKQVEELGWLDKETSKKTKIWVESLEDVIIDLQRLKQLENKELEYIKEINKEIEIIKEIINYIKVGSDTDA